MERTFQATYEQGILRLDAPLSLPEHARVTGQVTIISPPVEPETARQSVEEFDKLLDEFSTPGCPPLPSDFSRADIYLDHD